MKQQELAISVTYSRVAERWACFEQTIGPPLKSLRQLCDSSDSSYSDDLFLHLRGSERIKHLFEPELRQLSELRRLLEVKDWHKLCLCLEPAESDPNFPRQLRRLLMWIRLYQQLDSNNWYRLDDLSVMKDDLGLILDNESQEGRAHTLHRLLQQDQLDMLGQTCLAIRGLTLVGNIFSQIREAWLQDVESQSNHEESTVEHHTNSHSIQHSTPQIFTGPAASSIVHRDEQSADSIMAVSNWENQQLLVGASSMSFRDVEFVTSLPNEQLGDLCFPAGDANQSEFSGSLLSDQLNPMGFSFSP